MKSWRNVNHEKHGKNFIIKHDKNKPSYNLFAISFDLKKELLIINGS